MSNALFRFSLGRIFWPPSLIMRQFVSVLFFRYLIKWKAFHKWLYRHSFNSIPIAAGATGMGCIGYPQHPAWEVTSACNLSCIHCHAEENDSEENDLTTEEAKKFIDELRKVKEFRVLVYTGGEPLVRPDIFELLKYSQKAGFINVIATNGTLITDEVAVKLKEAGTAGIAVSLDGSKKEVHDKVRGDNAFNLAMRGIEAVKKAGIPLQINVTVMKYNFSDIENIIELAEEKKAVIMLMYQLVPVGRGNEIKNDALDLSQNKQLAELISKKQRNVSVIVEPVAFPQYWPYIMEKAQLTGNIWLKLAEKVFHGCAAARGFVYVKANGDVWPCPFVEIKAGNVKETPFSKIWSESQVFRTLRNREKLLKGKCGVCKYNKMCGGCRGKAMAYSGDVFAEDPSCFIKNALNKTEKVGQETGDRKNSRLQKENKRREITS